MRFPFTRDGKARNGGDFGAPQGVAITYAGACACTPVSEGRATGQAIMAPAPPHGPPIGICTCDVYRSDHGRESDVVVCDALLPGREWVRTTHLDVLPSL